MTNTELLKFRGPSQLLTTIEQQKRFILLQFALHKSCPNCATKINVFDATGTPIDAYDLNDSRPESFQCPKCKRGLKWILPLMASHGWHWWLIPEENQANAS